MFRSLVRTGTSLVRPQLRISSCIGPASFHSSSRFLNGNLFGELTKNDNKVPEVSSTAEINAEDVTPANDTALQEYYMKEALAEQIVPEKFISPIKKRLFDLNVQQHGFYKNNQLVSDPDTGKSYKLSLTTEEIDILEPSIFLHSYRIKSSMKKATTVNRFVRGYKVKNAINQLHFNPKKMSTELEILLKRGLKQARELQYNEDELYIHALWVGSDGNWQKRLDPKGRGRTGRIDHPYVHLKAVLRGEQTTKRLAWEAAVRAEEKKPRMFLNNEPLNFKVRPYYKW